MWTVMITRQWLGDLSLWCGRALFWRLKRDIEGFFGLCEAWWSYTSSNIAFILWGNRANLSPNVFFFKLKSVNSTGSSPTPISGTHLISFSIMSFLTQFSHLPTSMTKYEMRIRIPSHNVWFTFLNQVLGLRSMSGLIFKDYDGLCV